MSDELLTKENKFYELNGELERKTKELMREVNSVVSNTRFVDSDSVFLSDGRVPRIKTSDSPRVRKQNVEKCPGFTGSKYVPDSAIRDFKSETNLPRYLARSTQSVNEGITRDDETVKKTAGGGNDATVRFFKSKSKILESELEAIKLEYKKKCDYSVELQSENKTIDEERIRFYNQLTTLKDTLAKLEATNNSQLNNLQRTESENNALKKDIEALKKEVKTMGQNSSSYSIRLNRSLEDNERLRKALKCSQLDEKELRDENRRLEEDKKATVSNLEKQRNELLHAFKKQTLLVDNLKKQKAHLEANMLLKYTEEELLKLLDWKLNNV